MYYFIVTEASDIESNTRFRRASSDAYFDVYMFRNVL